jgi:hypothetical protein
LPNLQFRGQQIFYIVDWAGLHLKINPVIGSLEHALAARDMLFIQHWQTNSISRNREVGIRDSAVRADSDANILAWITGKAEKNAAVTRTDIKNY